MEQDFVVFSILQVKFLRCFYSMLDAFGTVLKVDEQKKWKYKKTSLLSVDSVCTVVQTIQLWLTITQPNGNVKLQKKTTDFMKEMKERTEKIYNL